MSTADLLLELIFSWIDQRERCAKQLRKLAEELESLREKCNAGQCVGSTVSVVGATCLIGAGIATVFTGGAAAPFLGLLGAAYTGAGVTISVTAKIIEHFSSGDTMQEAQAIEKRSNEIEGKIQKLFQQLKVEKEEASSFPDPDEVDRQIVTEFLRAMARRSGLKQRYVERIIIRAHEDNFDLRMGHRVMRADQTLKVAAVLGVLTFFTFQLSGKKYKLLLSKGAEQLIKTMSSAGFKTALKGGAMVVGGAVGLAFALPEAIENWKDQIEKNHVTEASQSLRNTADALLKITCNLREQLNNMKKMFDEVAKREQEEEERLSREKVCEDRRRNQETVESQPGQRYMYYELSEQQGWGNEEEDGEDDESDQEESDQEESDQEESNQEENDQEESDQEESDQEESDQEESNQEENDQEESDQEESDQEESDQEESNQEENDQEESDQEESDQEESDQVESDQEESDQEESDQVESDQVESDQVESDQEESDQVESDQEESDQVESDQVESDQEESDQVESDQEESDQVESDQEESDQVESDQVESDQEESDQVESDQEESDQVESDQEESDQVESDQEESDQEESDQEESDQEESDPAAIRVGLLNVRSMNNKPSDIKELITENKLDVLATTETHLNKARGDSVLRKASPDNFGFYHEVRGSRGGGVAIQFSLELAHGQIPFGVTTTFEYVATVLQRDEWDEPVLMINLYRRPGDNRGRFRPFLNEFEELLDEVFKKYNSIIVTGDFNIWVDYTKNSSLEFEFLLLLRNLRQHVCEATHERGHTLDLVITRNVQISGLKVQNDHISDHYTVLFNAWPASDTKEEDEENKDEDEQPKRFKSKEE
ncbi:uncharacterized protein LOC143333471 [Chaetodon auriga]|uniref:uncharacterized protein LOC143333471 n=1 Tax=Chaetodon auriga TaxID=39042 RepID=UPI004032BC20